MPPRPALASLAVSLALSPFVGHLHLVVRDELIASQCVRGPYVVNALDAGHTQEELGVGVALRGRVLDAVWRGTEERSTQTEAPSEIPAFLRLSIACASVSLAALASIASVRLAYAVH